VPYNSWPNITTGPHHTKVSNIARMPNWYRTPSTSLMMCGWGAGAESVQDTNGKEGMRARVTRGNVRMRAGGDRAVCRHALSRPE
jgi:hypothetical protein